VSESSHVRIGHHRVVGLPRHLGALEVVERDLPGKPGDFRRGVASTVARRWILRPLRIVE
jgi:hypothetical protein